MRKLSVWELSRLGRNTLEVLKTIEEFNTLGISLFIKNYNIETLNEDGIPNVMSQFLVLKSAISRQAKVNKFSLVFWLNEIVGIFFIAYKILYWTFKGIYWLLKGTLNKLFGNNW